VSWLVNRCARQSPEPSGSSGWQFNRRRTSRREFDPGNLSVGRCFGERVEAFVAPMCGGRHRRNALLPNSEVRSMKSPRNVQFGGRPSTARTTSTDSARPWCDLQPQPRLDALWKTTTASLNDDEALVAVVGEPLLTIGHVICRPPGTQISTGTSDRIDPDIASSASRSLTKIGISKSVFKRIF
jgi:hypothetical protein